LIQMVALAEARTRTVYEVRNPDGRLVAEHVRVETPGGKSMFWRREDGTVGLDGTRLEEVPLHGSERVKNWHQDDLIVVLEGEKAAQALLDAGFFALGTVTGAGGTPGAAVLEILRGRRVCLWPDHDDQGRAHMERIAAALDGMAAEVLVYTWHEAPDKGDAADHLAIQGGSEKALDRLWTDLEDAPRWKGATGVTVSRSLYRVVTPRTPVAPIRFSEMDPPEPREYAVEGIVPKGHTTSLYGDGGSAKSVIALSAGTAIAGGAGRWMGRRVQRCPVLYGDFELDADEQRRRAYQVARGVYLESPPQDLLYVSGLGRPPGEILAGCLEVCVAEGVGLFIIDSLGIALEGEAESASDVIRFHHEYLDPFRAAGVTLLVIDHQGKTQANERYQNKRTFGSVYKENLARSVLQVQPGDRGSGLLAVKIRQTKHNFGPKAKPFGARLAFTEEQITVSEHSLDATELAQEHTLNAADRVKMVLKDGPAYPADAAERSDLPLGSVKNALTDLRKRGLVEETGEVNPHTKAREVRLTDDGRTVTGVTPAYKGRDTVTPAPFSEEAI
jgi:AAA domain-containing protein